MTILIKCDNIISRSKTKKKGRIKTMKRWFSDCTTCEELKQKYHKLAIVYHPDNGGNDDIMKDINAQFDDMYKLLKDVHRKNDGTTWKAEKGSKNENKQAPEEYRKMVEEFLHYDVLIEFIGCYIWISGNTKPIKERLKEYGFAWASKKLAWYLKPENYKPMSRKDWTLDNIRDTFGVQASYKGKQEESKDYIRLK